MLKNPDWARRSKAEREEQRQSYLGDVTDWRKKTDSTFLMSDIETNDWPFGMTAMEQRLHDHEHGIRGD